MYTTVDFIDGYTATLIKWLKKRLPFTLKSASCCYLNHSRFLESLCISFLKGQENPIDIIISLIFKGLLANYLSNEVVNVLLDSTKICGLYLNP